MTLPHNSCRSQPYRDFSYELVRYQIFLTTILELVLLSPWNLPLLPLRVAAMGRSWKFPIQESK